MNKRVAQVILFVALLSYPYSVSAQDTLVLSAVEGTLAVKTVGAVLQRAYQPLGIQIEIHELPGKRGLRYSNKGITDGEAYRIQGIEKAYPNLQWIDVPVHVDQMYLFVKRGKKFSVEGWESIPKDTIIGYQRGVKFIENNTAQYKLKTIPVDSSDQLFRMLALERVDAIIEGAAMGLSVIKKLDLQGIVRLEPPIHTSVLYHYLHKKHTHLVPKITAVLKKMKARGEIQMIRKQIKTELSQ